MSIIIKITYNIVFMEYNMNLLKLSAFLLLTSSILCSLYAKDDLQKQSKKTKPEFETNWQKAYGGGSRDKAYDVIALDDGGAMVAGMSQSYGKGRSDMLIVKLDKSGKSIWRSSYGGKKKDEAFALTKSSDGNFFAVGYSESFSESGDKDVYVVKFDTEGKRAWQKTYGGSESDIAKAVTAVGGGGILVAGYTDSYGKGREDVYILYIDKDGKEIWSKAIGGKEEDKAYDISLTADGGFVVVGSTASYGKGRDDFYILKFDGDGKLQWDKIYGGGESDVLHAVTPTRDGGFVVAGETKSFDSKHKDIDIIKYSKNGKQVWHKIFGFDSKEWANDIIKITGGGYLLAGTTKSFGFGKFDFYLLEIDSKGSSVWANVFGGANKDVAHALVRKKDGKILVVGESESFGQGGYDFMMLELEKR
jgi:uncharacterized delta-60 repeat protein